MPGRGPPRKPTELKVIAGTDQPCRRNPNEPKPRRERPPAPAHLSEKAHSAWGYVSLVLDQMGVLTTADALALECLCEAYADLLSARTALAKRGASLSYETKTKEGGVMHRAYPEVAMVSDADRRFVMHLGRFGLTPADRSRVSAHGGGADENPFAAFG